jgi:hypothetical protein
MEKEKYHKFRSNYGKDLIEDIEFQKTNKNNVDNLISINLTRKEVEFVVSVLKQDLMFKRKELSDEEKEVLLKKYFNDEVFIKSIKSTLNPQELNTFLLNYYPN